MVSGCQVQGIYKFQSGGPLAWGNYILYGSPNDILLSSDKRSAEQWFNTSAALWEKATAKQLATSRGYPRRLRMGIKAIF